MSCLRQYILGESCCLRCEICLERLKNAPWRGDNIWSVDQDSAMTIGRIKLKKNEILAIEERFGVLLGSHTRLSM